MLQRAGNDTDAASVLLLNPQTQALEYVAGRGFRSRAIEQTQLRIGEDLPGRAALQRCVVGVGDLPHADEFKRGTLLASEKFTTYHAAPLVAKGQVKGIRAEQHRPADLPLDA